MRYVAAAAERTPFADASFDVVSAFNALDHVDDLGRTIAEFKRVTKPGGTFLLIADVNRDTTLLQPSMITWDVLDRFRPEFDVASDSRYEHNGEGLYQSITDAKMWSAASSGRGVLSAKLVRA
jgi:ubiquinone/menaquinone biosynthesis C-methylase UbiE